MLAMVFGKISLVSVLANIMVVGVVQLITLGGGIGLGLGLIWPMVGRGILWFIQPLLFYFSIVVEVWGGYEGWSLSFNILMMLGWYLLLLSFLLRGRRR